MEYINAFHAKHWEDILKFGTAFPEYAEFVENFPHEISDYIAPTPTKRVNKFLKQLQEGISEYVKEKEKDPKGAYDRLFTNPRGMKLAKRIKRDVTFNKLVFDRLQQELNKINKEPRAMHEMVYDTPSPQHEKSFIIKFVESVLGVRFVKVRFHTKMIWCWMHGIVVYDIYDRDEKISTVFLEVSDTVIPQSMPLIPRQPGIPSVTLVRAPLNQNLAHELTHAVQFAFESNYNIPKDLCEIPAMIVERLFRNETNNPVGKFYLRKHLSIALADLVSNDPETMNEKIAEFGNITDVKDLSSRIWHYAMCPGKYYGYVLGLIDSAHLCPYQVVRDWKKLKVYTDEN